MDVCINEEELTLLSYLHEKAEGYGEPFYFDTSPVGPEVGLDGQAMNKAVSYLGGWGLVAVTGTHELGILQFCFTSKGEDYMRHLDAAAEEAKVLAQSKKLTWEAVKGLAKATRDGLVKVAGELLAKYLAEDR
jgi:hypothetical protein